MVAHSPSSLSALELCERKYAWDKVDKIAREANPYAEFGTRTHAILQDYYTKGVMPDLTSPEGNCAVALLAHLPPPQPGLRVEEHRVHGRFHGYPDLTLGNRVWDHKTTSDHKWALSPEALALDLQAALYASFVMTETGTDRVTLQWNYVTRHKPRVLPVVREVTKADIQLTLERAERLADRADVILAKGLHALDLPPNPAACDMFGGCVHRLRCGLTSGERLSSLMAQSYADDPYAQARARAQADANATGCDFGLEWNALTREWRVFGLPRRENRQGHELRCEVVSCENLEKCAPGHGPVRKEEKMTSAADFQNAMNNSHPPVPPPPPALPVNGPVPPNPWDGLPSTHVTETQWYNGRDWVAKVAAPPPPPPPAAAAPPAPPPVAVPINPPVPAAVAPPPPAEAAPAPARRGRPPGSKNKPAEAPPPPPAAAAPSGAPQGERALMIAALEAALEVLRGG